MRAGGAWPRPPVLAPAPIGDGSHRAGRRAAAPPPSCACQRGAARRRRWRARGDGVVVDAVCRGWRSTAAGGRPRAGAARSAYAMSSSSCLCRRATRRLAVAPSARARRRRRLVLAFERGPTPRAAPSMSGPRGSRPAVRGRRSKGRVDLGGASRRGRGRRWRENLRVATSYVVDRCGRGHVLTRRRRAELQHAWRNAQRALVAAPRPAPRSHRSSARARARPTSRAADGLGLGRPLALDLRRVAPRCSGAGFTAFKHRPSQHRLRRVGRSRRLTTHARAGRRRRVASCHDRAFVAGIATPTRALMDEWHLHAAGAVSGDRKAPGRRRTARYGATSARYGRSSSPRRPCSPTRRRRAHLAERLGLPEYGAHAQRRGER